jgi:hypothetical protein
VIRSNALRFLQHAGGAVLTLALTAAPVLADEKDELSIPDSAMAAQRKVLTMIGAVIAAGVIAYGIRWWQATHSGNVVSGGGQGDD